MALIRANRESIDDRFSVLGFTVRTENPLFEIGLATDPELLKAENRSRRNAGNFFSSSLLGANARRGEAVYLVPPNVVSRFVGQPRLYFGLATYREGNRSEPVSVKTPDRGNMYVNLSGLTERGLRRTARANGTGAYGNGNGQLLTWGGDAKTSTSPSASNGSGNGAGHAAAPNGGPSMYSDGYSDDLWQPDTKSNATAPVNGNATTNAPAAAQAWTRGLSVDEFGDDNRGIEGPIPDHNPADDPTFSTPQSVRGLARPLNAPAPEYPQAARFVAAHSGNFRATTTPRTIERIVIHITDGSANINGTISWFQNPSAGVSAHYVIGQDGEIVQMVRHNDVAWHARSANRTSIGIEHVANTRGLNPTPAQMCASAALVTWLCDQYGIAADRTHILGHSEADTATTHTGCPNAVWDWAYYMEMITTRTCFEPTSTTANTLGYGRPGYGTPGYGSRGSNGHGGAASRAQYAPGPSQTHRARQPMARPFLVESYDQPTGWFDALTTQLGHFARGAMWFMGVSDTTQPPYSAICQVRIPDGTAEGTHQGTAFFIAPRLLLTAAHVVDGQSELIIVPGKNGGGISGATEPFGRFRVTQFEKHPSYGSNGSDNDMALICVPEAHGAIGQNYFNLVEELTQSRPEGVVVSGYAANWYATSDIELFVNANIDHNRQHAHGGYIREIPTDGTFAYDLQTLGGTSGSPVYWIEEGGLTPRAHMVGVHVAANDNRTNLGCRITQEKLTWIRRIAAQWSQTLSFSMGARGARALSFGGEASDGTNADAAFDDVEQYTHVPEPVEDEFATEQSYRARALTAPTPDYPGASRFVAAHSRNFHVGRRRGAVIDRIVIHITAGGPSINGTIGWFQNGDRTDPKTGVQAGPSSAHYIVGRDGEVVQMVRNADTAYHASNANSRSIGIEHNANKPYRLNRRDLPPTQEQYQASAHLVAWLAAQYGVPLDRTHIVGHIEATPGDNHDCPSSYWDWDTYMQCVLLAAQALAQNSSTGAVPATSQALRNRTPARAQEIITPYYDPSDPATALMCQNNAFSLAMEEWFVGVDDTHAFPHSAICLLEMKNAAGAVTGRGTGFYIGPNRILTCGHNLIGQHSVDIIPANNGRGNEPFGRCNVGQASWRIPQAYIDNQTFDNDLAVIDNVPIAAPGNAYFTFLNATPSDQMPLVVCGYSSRSEAVPELTAAIDGFKQHLHGGYARQMVTHDTIDYPILTLKRASGSPVYTLRDIGNGLQALICAVHVSGLRADQGVNTGCFITPTKIDWIEGRATTLSYRAPAATPTRNGTYAPPRTASRPSVRAQELITPYYDPSNPASALQCTNDAFSQQREEWYVGVQDTSAFPHSAICHLSMVDAAGDTYTGSGFYIGPNRILTCAHNLHNMVSATVTPSRNGAGSAPVGQFHLSPSQWRVAPRYSGDGDWDNDLAVIDNTEIAAPHGAYFRFMQATPGGTMPLAVCGYSAASRLVRELNPIFDRDKQHLHGGHAQGQATFDTIDYDILAIAGASGSPVYTVRDEGNGLEAFVCGVHVTRGPIEASGGPSVNRGCFITPTKIDWIEGRATTFSYRGNTMRALSGDASDHPVALIPQPDKNACWAASMAMLVSFRRNASFAPETLANEVGGSLVSSYSWELLDAVRARYGFEMIAQPSNTSLYHTPQQWSQWLSQYGPLWVVIVGAPHAVVIAGVKGDLARPETVQVKILNPWDTRIAFDNDPVAFNPRNNGYEDWLSFEQFAADFGNMAEADYGNWRVLHLPATAAGAQTGSQQNGAQSAVAQSLGARGRRLVAAPPSRSLSVGTDFVGTATGDTREPIEPSRVPGTRMAVLRGRAGASRWSLDQLEGRKSPTTPSTPSTNSAAGSSPTASNVVIELGAWPAIEGEAAPLPLTITFHSTASGAVGDVQISAGTPADLLYGVDVVARIEDAPDVGNVAALKVGIDYRFNGFAHDAPAARIELRLLGDGRYERVNRWLTTAQAA